jgi:dienelactone hydrolase
MRFVLFTAIMLLLFGMTEAQQKITFPSSDGIIITADQYGQDAGKPYIILFHQANFSRGEYKETAPKLQKLGYNCLAVDLRSGKEVNYIQNETAAKAREKNLPTEYIDAEKDMIAALEYVKKITKEKIILFGSSYSASLALRIGKNEPTVSAIIAFSPGEYFGNIKLKSDIAKINKPVFIGSTKSEKPYIQEMISGINEGMITWFVPSKAAGIHGSRALWNTTPESKDCWMQLMLFFKNLKK